MKKKYYFLFLIILKSVSNLTLKNELLSKEQFNMSHYILFLCSDSIKDCSNHGECDSENKDCICFHGYSTFFSNFTNHFTQIPRCNYKVKKQLYALVIACFMSFGMVHFYLENYLIGYFQLSLFLLIFLINSFLIVKLSLKHLKNNSESQLSSTMIQIIVIIFLSFVFILWYIIDIIMILTNMYRDANNQEMAIIL